MTINANTKIGSLIKENPDALEAIVSISPKFSKLRNPILRKVIAGRTSIAMASKLGGCSIDDFFRKLEPLGFSIDKLTDAKIEIEERRAIPDFMKQLSTDRVTTIDVRPVIDSGKDPLDLILQKVKALETEHVLKIINSFEPAPLMHLLGKQGFLSYAEPVNEELVNTYFYKPAGKAVVAREKKTDQLAGWEEVMERFKNDLITIDVRALEMPLPMHAILESLANLPPGKALFVHHKRIPVFLLPELEEQQFNYRIKEVSGAEIQLLIYKD